MARKMTIVFDDEQLYTALKVEAARSHRPAKDIVAEALTVFFEATPEEHSAMLRRARRRGEDDSPVERVLQELGLARGEGLPAR